MAEQTGEPDQGRRICADGDEFASRYMADDTDVVYRDKRVSRGMTGLVGSFGLGTIALAIFIAFKNAGLLQPAPAWAVILIMGLLGAFGLGMMALGVAFGVVRTLITRDEVLVKYGLSGPSIALDSITSCRVVDYKWTRFGGFGVRIGLDGTRAYVPGPGQVVELTYQDGAKERKVQIGAGDPHALARAIQQARQARPPLRIATEPSDAAAEAAQQTNLQAQAEAETALEAQAERQPRERERR